MNTYQSLIGALLALTTAVFWGALPLAMKQVLQITDTPTLVCARFTVAAAWIWLMLSRSAHRPTKVSLSLRYVLLFSITALGLGVNFGLFNASVKYLSAPAAQIISQAGPVLLILGSVVILRERLNGIQKIGMAVLVTGLVLFFNQHLGEFLHGQGDYVYGIFLGFLGAVAWAAFAIAQKSLLRTVTAPQIMCFVYTCAAIGFFPMASPGTLLQVNGVQAFCLAFCCLNTIVAYGAFSEAMARWEAAKVSALLTLTPLFSLIFSELAWWLNPAMFPTERLNLLGIVGAFVVVFGALTMTRGRQQA